jgi:nucleoside-diphosphate-sugar epimerase
MRRIAVVGGASPLGRMLADRLASRPDVECVRAIENRAPRVAPARSGPSTDGSSSAPSLSSDSPPDAPDFEVVPFAPDPRPFAELLVKERIDTVVHANLVPDRCGVSVQAREADVIGAMCLGAAIGQAGSLVRSWVVASSSAIYPIGSQAALLHDERRSIEAEPASLAASIAEAEDYAREAAHRLPHVDVAILRLQQLAGYGLEAALARHLAQDPIPAPAGFDPAIQLLHAEDALDAIAHSVLHELAGVYNVASAGLIRFEEAIRASGRSSIPVLPIGVALFEPLLARTGVPFLAAALAPLLRYGHALDTRKLERTGWRPRFDQAECVVVIGGG